MKVAIPTFGSRVSPRFDCAQVFLIVTIEDGQPGDREQLVASSWAPYERINKLVEFDVDTVVCGGIDYWSAESLRSAGIVLYGWVSSTIDEALYALCQGKLNAQALATADGRCRRGRGLDSGSQRREDEQPSQEPNARGHRQRRRGGRGRCAPPGSAD